MAENHAVIYTEYGDSSVLTHTTLPVPKPKDDEVLVRMRATGINPVDWKLRKGLIKAWPQTLPIVPGWDAAGEVEDTGKNSGFAKGDRVYAYTRPAFDMGKDEQIDTNTGTCQTFMVIPAWKVAKAPTTSSHAQASSVPLAALTAYQGLHSHLKVETEGVETLLVINASGGVGGFVVGLAKAAGIKKVIGVCSGKNAEYVKSLGADEVVDYKQGPISDQIKEKGWTIDAVYDAIGGEETTQALKVLKEGGRIVSIAQFDVADLAEKEGKKQTGMSFLVKPSGDELRTIAQLLDEGKIKYPKLTTYALSEVKKAHEESESNHTQGKIALEI